MQHAVSSRTTGRSTVRGRIAAVALTVAALAAAGLAAPAGAATPRPATATEVSTTKDAKLGTILVADDNTVYTLKGKACTAQCLKTWKPVVLPDGDTTASAGNGVDEAKLGTKETAGGALQITYAGKALFWSTKDKAPGDVKGAGSDKFGKWSVVVTAKGSGDSGTTNAGTGGAAF